MTKTEDWATGAKALARALGAVHAAVSLSLVGHGQVPVGLLIVAGAGVFYTTGRVKGLPSKQTAAFRYAGPMTAALFLRLAVSNPPDFDAGQAEAVGFLVDVWATTPVPCYLLCAAYGLAKAERVVLPSPFDPPMR